MTGSTIKTVLIVDDSRLSRMLIIKFIHQHYPSWSIIEADNGAQAIDKTKVFRPDFITMDYNMTGMNGAETAKEILAFAPHIPIVLFTANVQQSTQQEAETIGLFFVGKPVTDQTTKQALDYFVSRTWKDCLTNNAMPC